MCEFEKRNIKTHQILLDIMKKEELKYRNSIFPLNMAPGDSWKGAVFKSIKIPNFMSIFNSFYTRKYGKYYVKM